LPHEIGNGQVHHQVAPALPAAAAATFSAGRQLLSLLPLSAQRGWTMHTAAALAAKERGKVTDPQRTAMVWSPGFQYVPNGSFRSRRRFIIVAVIIIIIIIIARRRE